MHWARSIKSFLYLMWSLSMSRSLMWTYSADIFVVSSSITYTADHSSVSFVLRPSRFSSSLATASLIFSARVSFIFSRVGGSNSSRAAASAFFFSSSHSSYSFYLSISFCSSGMSSGSKSVLAASSSFFASLSALKASSRFFCSLSSSA